MRFEFTGRAQEVIAKMFAFADEWRSAGEEGEPVFEVRLHRRKRGNTQNAYYWVLVGKLARAMGYATDEVHRRMLWDYGVYDVMLIRADVPLASYFKYFDVVATGYVQGRLYNHVRVFKGSSQMDSTEFSHLLDGLVQECAQQGIETKPPWEIARMEFVGGAA